MGIQYLKKIVDTHNQLLHIDNKFDIFVDKPFYCLWSGLQECTQDNLQCFNHILSMPKKNDKTFPLFRYEQEVIKLLEHEHDINTIKHKHAWILKSTGLGLTELILRYMAWLCVTNDRLANSSMCIVTGPRELLAINLMDRLKGLFTDRNLLRFTEKNTVCYLNKVRLEVFPSHHLDAMRGLKNVSFIFLDESDFFPPGQQQDALGIAERYIAKSDPYIVLCSTPNAPNMIMQQIEMQPDNACLYHRIKLPYEIGLRDGMFTEFEIEKAKASLSFNREYGCQYLGQIGNVYNPQDIQLAIEDKYDLSHDAVTSRFTPKYMSLDCAWGSSDFGILICSHSDGKFNVLYEAAIGRPSFSEMIQLVEHLLSYYPNIKKVIIDGANPGFIKECKVRFGDSYTNYELLPKEKTDMMLYTEIPKFVPFNFATLGKQSLRHSYKLLSKGLVRIDPRFTKLLTALRTATTKGEWDLDKSSDASQYNDLTDCFRMICMLRRDRGGGASN